MNLSRQLTRDELLRAAEEVDGVPRKSNVAESQDVGVQHIDSEPVVDIPKVRLAHLCADYLSLKTLLLSASAISRSASSGTRKRSRTSLAVAARTVATYFSCVP
jgi:hypothetical protein